MKWTGWTTWTVVGASLIGAAATVLWMIGYPPRFWFPLYGVVAGVALGVAWKLMRRKRRQL